MNRQEIIADYSKLINTLGVSSKEKVGVELDFIIEGNKIYAVNNNSPSDPITVAFNKNPELFAWEPEQIAYQTVSDVIDERRSFYKKSSREGKFFNAEERAEGLREELKRMFSQLNLNEAYEPKN
jgi:hypothetical protein